MGFAKKPAQQISIIATGIFFVLLQLWEPLGATLTGWYGGKHVADPTDLIALPILLLVPVCWQPVKRVLPLALGISLIACVATVPPHSDARYPCDKEEAWDPTVPLFLEWSDLSSGQNLPIRTPAFQSGIQLSTADGKKVDFFLANTGRASVVICPEGGLEPATEYVWSIGPFRSDSNNAIRTPHFEQGGSWSFVTDEIGDNKPIGDAAACRAVSPKVYEALYCNGDDTGAM